MLLTNAVVLTMDPQFTVHRPGAVAITGDAIVAVGPGALAYQAAETIDCGGRVVMPGLVNAHTHVPMTLLRGLADDLRLDVWLMGYMMPVERAFVSPDFVRLGTRLALRRDDPVRRDLLRRHVLLRGCGRRGHGRRPACARSARRRCCASRRPTRRATRSRWRCARDFIQRWRGHPLIVPGAGAARALHLHAGNPARLRRARRRVRRPAPHPPVGDGAGSGRLAAAPRDAGGAVGQEARPASTRRSWPRTACTWTTGRSAR